MEETPVEEFEKALIENRLWLLGRKKSDLEVVAATLGISVEKLYGKIKEYKIDVENI